MLLAGAIAALLFLRSAGRTVLGPLEEEVRARGGVLRIERLRHGLFEDDVFGARVELGDGTALEAPEARLSRPLFGAIAIHVPEARVTLRSDPVSAFAGFRTLAGAVPAGLSVGRVSVDYQHRSVGHLVLDGIRRAAGGRDDSFTVRSLRHGRMSWSDVAFSATQKERALEVSLGAAEGASPRVTARYLASDGRAGEWLVQLPHQSLADLLRSLGWSSSQNGAEPTRISGTFSWVVPEDPAVPARGSFHFVLDRWQRPAWPEANALVGSTGSFAASVTPGASPASFRLERVKVESAHFPLDGSGTVTLGERPELALEAKGRRACTELGRTLPSSRYREAIEAYDGADGEAAELSLAIEVSARDGAGLGFRWRLPAGCGLDALGTNGDGAN